MTRKNLRRRPLRLDDAHEHARTNTDIAVCAGSDERFTASTALIFWQEPSFDLGSSSLGIFDGDKLAAYAILWANAETPVRPWLRWGVHPDYHDAELSAELFAWADDLGGQVMLRCPDDARFSLQTGAPQGYAFAENALTQAGYVAARADYEMRIDMRERPPEPELPPGFVYQTYRHEQDLPLLTEVVVDTFSDHFGYVEQSFDKELEEMRHWFRSDENFDPALVMLLLKSGRGRSPAAWWA